jgi:hypothetical protein
MLMVLDKALTLLVSPSSAQFDFGGLLGGVLKAFYLRRTLDQSLSIACPCDL